MSRKGTLEVSHPTVANAQPVDGENVLYCRTVRNHESSSRQRKVTIWTAQLKAWRSLVVVSLLFTSLLLGFEASAQGTLSEQEMVPASELTLVPSMLLPNGTLQIVGESCDLTFRAALGEQEESSKVTGFECYYIPLAQIPYSSAMLMLQVGAEIADYRLIGEDLLGEHVLIQLFASEEDPTLALFYSLLDDSMMLLAIQGLELD